MIKKIAAMIICAVIAAAAVIPFTACAADVAEFKLCVESQNDKTVTVTVDFAGGTGFNALDLSVEYNRLKLSLEESQFASGFAAFKKYAEGQGGFCNFTANEDENPVRISVVSQTAYQVVDGDGSLFRLRFSKIEGANISENDISVSVDNYAVMDPTTKEISEVKATVSYDLTNGASSSASDETVEAETIKSGSSESQTENGAAANSGENTTTAQTEAKSANAADKSVAESESQTQVTKVEKGLSNKDMTVVFIVIGIIGIAAVAVLVVIIIKNKKKKAVS